jgi:hypothetical protein
MVERRERLVPLTDAAEPLPIRRADDDLVGITIDDKQAVARRRRDHVAIRENIFAPRREPFALRIMRDDARRGRIDQRIGAQQHVDLAGRVDCDVCDPPRPIRQVAERPFHPVALRAQCDDKFAFHHPTSPLPPLSSQVRCHGTLFARHSKTCRGGRCRRWIWSFAAGRS